MAKRIFERQNTGRLNYIMENQTEINTNLNGQEQVIPAPSVIKPSRKNLILIVVLILITSILLILSLFPKTPARQSAPTLAPYVKSSLSLSTPQKNLDGNYSSNIEITTAQNQVTGVQISIIYDPKVLTNVAINPGTFFKNPNILLQKVDPLKGNVIYSLFANPNQKSVSGKGTIATLSFSVIPGTKSTTQINFLPTTEVVALGQLQSVLKTTTGTVFNAK